MYTHHMPDTPEIRSDYSQWKRLSVHTHTHITNSHCPALNIRRMDDMPEVDAIRESQMLPPMTLNALRF